MPTPTATDIRATNLTADERRFLERNARKLSKTTMRAKWTHEPGERADRRGQTLATRSPDVIRDWADRRRAEPATATRRDGRPATLRLDFPQGGRANLEHIDWGEWLRTFEERELVFLYQEERRDGNESNFFRLDSPEREDG